MRKLEYITDSSTGIEVVSLEKVNIAYPPHTHVEHYVMGIVTEGAVSIQVKEQRFVCQKGEVFTVAPDVCHSIQPETEYFSMITVCIPATEEKGKDLDIIKKQIIGNSELDIPLADMAEQIHISKYHLIRKFTDENGITPHRFQIQCRIRKAQRLLEQGEKVIDVAQAVGFCDQSHLDRAFKKQVGISPEEYANSAILSKA